MIALLLLAAVAAADPACTQVETVPGFEAWGHPAGSALAVVSEAALALQPATNVHFEPALARAPGDGTYGGFFPLTVTRAGRYRFALSAGAWIDLVSKGERLMSVAHQHGPACSGIAKIVAFDLQPGRYWLQVSEAKAPSISAMVSSAG